MRISRLRYALRRPVNWTRFWCRWNGHPSGPVWNNASGYEPNMHCRKCNDDLG